MLNRRSLLLIGACLLVYVGCSEQAKDPPNVVADRCGLCHADIPPRDSATAELIHYRHFQYTERSKQCYKCHLNYDSISGWKLDSLHRNGRREPSTDTTQMQCKLCHDYRDCWGCHTSPFTDEIANPAATKIHRSHVIDYLSFKCDSCHKGYDLDEGEVPVKHDNGTIEVNFGAGNQGLIARYSAQDTACYNLYCHGATTIGGKQSVRINDKMSHTDSTRCSFCHSIDSLRLHGTHAEGEHVKNKVFNDCENCHTLYSVKQLATDTLKHRNGHIDHISQERCDQCHGVKTEPALPDQ